MMGLRLHARLDHAVDEVGKEVEEVCEVLELAEEDGEDVADACEKLHAVVEADDAVVTRICHDLALILHKETCGGDCKVLAQ